MASRPPQRTCPHRLLQRFDFAFERGASPLQYKYDLTLNLQGTALCTATVKSEKEWGGGEL